MSDATEPSSTSRYFKLGLFMLIGVTLVVTGIIVLGAGALFQKSLPAETLVYESVNGLDVGSSVKYRGVPIGKVSEIIFSSAKYKDAPDESGTAESVKDTRGILIEMALSERAFRGESEKEIADTATKLVSKGLRARVTPAGISGQSYMELDILNPDDHPPPPINWKPDVLYIPSAPSTIGQVIDAAGQIASDLKKANLGKVVGHVDELTQQATATISELRQLLAHNKDNLNRTMAELPGTAVELRSTITRTDQIVHDPKLEKAIAGLSGVGESAAAALADIRRLAREASELLTGETDDVRSIIADLRRLASDGAALTDDARQNPSRVLFGKPPPPDSRQSPAGH